jgi:uncharacterized protein YkwD
MVRLFFLALLALPTFTPAAADPATASPTDNISKLIENQAFALVNDYRKANDLPPLVWNPAVAELAREHSKDMATGAVDFGHEGFSDRISRLKKSLGGLAAGGENVFMTDMGGDVAQTAVAVWLKSAPHLHNIRGDFNNSGIGIWEGSDGAIYFTQIFVKLRPPPEETDAVPDSPAGAPGIFFAAPMPVKQ